MDKSGTHRLTLEVPPVPSRLLIIDIATGVVGAIYGAYQHYTRLKSAFACWGVVAGMN